MTHSSYKPWHSILTSPKRLNLPSVCQFVRQRQPDKLDPWLEQAQKAAFSFQPFAKRLREDYDAVRV